MERNVNIVKDVNGNNIVIINDIRFKGKRSIDWDDVKAYETKHQWNARNMQLQIYIDIPRIMW